MFPKQNLDMGKMQGVIEQGLSNEIGKNQPQENKGPMSIDDMKSQIQDMITMMNEMLHNMEEIMKSMDVMNTPGA